ncbi:hypothetical protein [Roseibium sp. SCP14]
MSFLPFTASFRTSEAKPSADPESRNHSREERDHLRMKTTL